MRALVQRAVRAGALQRLPEAVKAPFRPFLSADRLYDADLLLLGLDYINDTDVFLCSFPKSGNTWVRFLIAHLTEPGATVTFRNIDAYVPEPGKGPRHLNRMTVRPVMKTHWPLLPKFPRAIYVVRDPRDAMVSFFHYRTRRGAFHGSMADFIRHEPYCGPWDRHAGAALAERERRPASILVLRYEDLVADADAGVRAIARFLGHPASDAEIAEAVRACSFSRLRENEDRFGGERDAADRGFFRKGVAGGWRQELAADDARFLEDRYGAVMTRLGYL